MSVVCRVFTVAALLLHLIFGCSLHHAVACGHYEHGGCQHTCSLADSLSVHADHACDHKHDHENGGVDEDRSSEDESSQNETVQARDNARQLMAPCCVCESQPCEGNHPGCHGEVECSFAPPNHGVFLIDVPFAALLSYELDPMASYVRSWAKRTSQPRPAWMATGSLSHCAALCTWII